MSAKKKKQEYNELLRKFIGNENSTDTAKEIAKISLNYEEHALIGSVFVLELLKWLGNVKKKDMQDERVGYVLQMLSNICSIESNRKLFKKGNAVQIVLKLMNLSGEDEGRIKCARIIANLMVDRHNEKELVMAGILPLIKGLQSKNPTLQRQCARAFRNLCARKKEYHSLLLTTDAFTALIEALFSEHEDVLSESIKIVSHISSNELSHSKLRYDNVVKRILFLLKFATDPGSSKVEIAEDSARILVRVFGLDPKEGDRSLLMSLGYSPILINAIAMRKEEQDIIMWVKDILQATAKAYSVKRSFSTLRNLTATPKKLMKSRKLESPELSPLEEKSRKNQVADLRWKIKAVRKEIADLEGESTNETAGKRRKRDLTGQESEEISPYRDRTRDWYGGIVNVQEGHGYNLRKRRKKEPTQAEEPISSGPKTPEPADLGVPDDDSDDRPLEDQSDDSESEDSDPVSGYARRTPSANPFLPGAPRHNYTDLTATHATIIADNMRERISTDNFGLKRTNSPYSRAVQRKTARRARSTPVPAQKMFN